MGLRGPQPTPTAILRARGSWLVNHRKDEPRPEPGRPPCPRWLNKDARKIWKALIPQLEKMGVLTKIDGTALARYCAFLEWWRREMKFVDKHGSTYPVQRKDAVLFKSFPNVRVIDMLSSQLTKLEQAFGLTPAARARLQTELTQEKEVSDDGDKQRFLKIS